MTATNDITGDEIATGHATEAYRNNYDAIFRKHKEVEEWPENRVDVIGQNGNTADSYQPTES